MECYFAWKYGVFGASECKRGIRGKGGGLFANFSALFREIMAGLGWEIKLLTCSLEIDFSLCVIESSI